MFEYFIDDIQFWFVRILKFIYSHSEKATICFELTKYLQIKLSDFYQLFLAFLISEYLHRLLQSCLVFNL